MFARHARRAFSLIELVIVVVIIGIIAAIAIPRMSRGATGAGDSALTANLAVLRNAIDLFQSEHGGAFPSGTSANVTNQLVQYSDASGTPSATPGGSSIYGPYLRSVPPLPVGARKGDTGFNVVTGAGTAFSYSSTAGQGWWYNSTTGDIRSNTQGTEQDASAKLYSAY